MLVKDKTYWKNRMEPAPVKPPMGAKNQLTKANKAAKKAQANANKATKKAAKEEKKRKETEYKAILKIIKKQGDAALPQIKPLLQKFTVDEMVDLVSANSLLGTLVDANAVETLRWTVVIGYPLCSQSNLPLYLNKAVEKGFLEIIQILLEKFEINLNSSEELPLCIAAAHDKNSIEIAKYLFEKGADINKADKYSRSAFLYAAKSGNPEMLIFLKANGADVIIRDKKGYDAIFYAAENTHRNSVKMFKILVDFGLDINSVDNKGTTPLFKYIKEGYLVTYEKVKAMVSLGADINIRDDHGNTIYHIFSDRYKMFDSDKLAKIFGVFTEKGLSIDTKNTAGRTPLLHRIVMGYDPLIKVWTEPIKECKALILAGAHVKIVGPSTDTTRPHTTPLIEAIWLGFYTVAKDLMDAGADLNWLSPTGSKKSALHRLVVNSKGGTPELITDFLARPGVNKDIKLGLPSANAPIHLAVQIPKLIRNVKALVDGGVNVNATDTAGLTAIYHAAAADNAAAVEYLCTVPTLNKEQRYGDRGTLFKIAQTTQTFKAPINEIILRLLKSNLPLWKGWSRANAAKFDGIFSEDAKEAADVTCCPICLKTVVREDGCVYMQGHNCSNLEGFYHEVLYNKYKNDKGLITWCTICGRIAHGHRHYEMGPAQGTKPPLLHAGSPFTTDCRLDNGGGGIPEKLSRYRRMREYALELQDEIGKKTEQEALEELVEEMWNAPMTRKPILKKILEERAWNIPASAFPLPPAESAETVEPVIDITTLPDIVKPDTNAALTPIELKGKDDIMQEPDVDVIQFRHRQPDGTVYDHNNKCISADSLELFISGMNGKYKTDEGFGLCWAFPGDCKGRLYPSDIKPYVGPEIYNEYRQKFNYKFRAKVGGAFNTRKLRNNVKNVFVPATNAQCNLPKRRNTMKQNKTQ